MLLLSSALVFATFLISIAVIVHSVSDNLPRIIEVIETRHTVEKNIRVVKVGVLKSAKLYAPLRSVENTSREPIQKQPRIVTEARNFSLPLAA